MIRDRLYTKYLADISYLAEKLDDALDTLPSCPDRETMEEEEIRHALYRAADKLNDAKRAIEYYSSPIKEEGYLTQNSRGRFELNGHEFTSGSKIEVYLNENLENDIEEGWLSGRVEHTGNKGYYFYGPSKPSLYEGMRARTRE
jgi:hypothetical protein